MPKNYNIRVRLTESQGREIHEIALREGRNQTNALTKLISEALSARRSARAEILRMAKERPDIARLACAVTGRNDTETS